MRYYAVCARNTVGQLPGKQCVNISQALENQFSVIVQYKLHFPCEKRQHIFCS